MIFIAKIGGFAEQRRFAPGNDNNKNKNDYLIYNFIMMTSVSGPGLRIR